MSDTSSAWNVRRHSGRSGVGWRIVYVGNYERAERRYERIAAELRQGAVELRCGSEPPVRFLTAPTLRTRW